ncbi:CHAD domain-containing protein [Mucilaginibacter yixingensis]|uniref:CHAD domain-containing protein n=1 Tax=Mucilaginibacter yixingensis TaxID=1295612 RepID=A0A2T5JGS3_9SPHI|nr:CHAD domain-containing protein [Mucilaginibacter yixingensis]PTR01609.1 CHAD domain-containing protein [Mucilaginibacter yixingensis]
MKRQAEITYFDKLWRKMRRNLEAYLQSGEMEDLHRFRVQVKKIRAFMILAESAQKKLDLQYQLKPVKKLFKRAGEIRAVDLHLVMARKQLIKAGLLDEQLKQRDKALAKFRPLATRRLHKLSRIKKKIHKEIKPIGKVHVSLFYANKLKKIDKSLGRICFDNRLHNCRKQLKVLLYNQRLVGPSLNIGFNKEYVDRLQITIGDWHDNQVAKQLFKNDRSALNTINRKDAHLKSRVKQTAKDMYNKATTAGNLSLPQLS